MDSIADKLLTILLNETLDLAERHDALLDLRDYLELDFLEILYKIAMNKKEDPIILDTCGEIIAIAWVKYDIFDLNMYDKFQPLAKMSAYAYLKNFKLEWIGKYNLEEVEK